MSTSTLINDPYLEPEIQSIIARRQESGSDQYDEVWNGVYVMSPWPNDEHQSIATRMASILDYLLGWNDLAIVRGGVNISDREENWRDNYRVPDVAVFLNDTNARNCGAFWLGGPDFLMEVVSPRDQSHEKLPFYYEVGVREVLIVNRDPWQLELYRREDDELKEVSIATLANSIVIGSSLVPLTFELVFGDDRPRIEVKHVVGSEEKQRWVV